MSLITCMLMTHRYMWNLSLENLVPVSWNLLDKQLIPNIIELLLICKDHVRAQISLKTFPLCTASRHEYPFFAS